MYPASTSGDNDESTCAGAHAVDDGFEPDFPSGASLTEEQQNALYDSGQKLYQQRQFPEATCIFVYLTMQNMFNARYAFALGACLQAQSALEAACQAYSLCRLLEPENPLAAFYHGECQMQLGNRDAALENYRDAARLSENLPQQSALAIRARGLADLIEGIAKA